MTFLWTINATEAVDELWDLEPYEDDHETKFQIPDADLKDAAGKPFDNKLLANTFINAEVLLPNEDSRLLHRLSNKPPMRMDV
jgi:hypothetical protein